MAQLVISILPLLLLMSHFLPAANAMYNVVSYGASPDGMTDSTEAFHSAWAAACSSSGPEAMYVPAGSFAVGHVTFSGPCNCSKITIQIDGTLVALSNSVSFGTQGYWIAFKNVNGVSVYGGTIDGRGKALWDCKASRGSCLVGATSLTFRYSENIMISGLNSINSELYHIAIFGCKGVTLQGIKISAPGNAQNTDGIHVQMSTDVTIINAGIKTGDDCISIGAGTINLWIEHITCGPGHGISIGSLGRQSQESGVENVTVKSTVFSGTQNGLRIKTWGRPSGGFVKGIVYEHARMQNVQNPIIIDQNYYTPNSNQSSGVTISDVTYNDIYGSSATPVAVKFDCSASNPCSGIMLQDIKLTYRNGQAESSCTHAHGTTSGFIVPPSCL